jgi:hypothetical protein
MLDINGFKHDSLTTPPSRMFNSPSFATQSLDYAELTPNFIVRAGNVDRAANPNVNRIGFSFDGGSNWFQASGEPGGVTGGGTVAAAADASRVLWSPPGATPHFSTNTGSSWTASSGIPSGAVVESDRVNPLKFYGLANGTFYVSTNGGVSFSAAATGLPTTNAKFKAVPGREGDIWLAGGSEDTVYGLWHSTNSGATFTRLANLEEADNIGFGRAATGQTYPALYTSAQVGGVRGIYRSIDAGATWVRINDNQHQYAAINGAITGDPRVFGRVFVATNGRGIIWGEPSTTNPDPTFTVAASPASVSVNRGASATSTISISRTAFTSSVAFSVSGLPSGVTGTFSPTSTTANSVVLTLNASNTATLGAATITVTGTGGGLSRSASIALTVGGGTNPDPTFALSASPAALAVNRGANGTSTISLARTAFTGSVAFSVSGLPSGVTASFSPTSTTGNSVTITLSASTTAAIGASTLTVTGTSGSLSRTTTLSLTVNGGGTDPGGGGGVTVTPAVSGSPWFNEQLVRINNTAPLTALSVTIVIQRTPGVSYSGQYNTVGGQIQQSNSSTTAAVTYQYTMASGQTLGAGSNRSFVAQASGNGTAHPASGDTWTVTYTTGGQSFTQSGTF